MNAIPYEAAHLEQLMAGNLNTGAERLGYMMNYAHRLEQPDWAYTIVDDDQVLFCTGIMDMWPGTGEVWFIGSQEIHRRPRAVVEFCRREMRFCAKERGLWRIQGVCRADWPQALRFAEFFGFRNEGLMRRYGPEGSDYYRVAWFPDEH